METSGLFEIILSILNHLFSWLAGKKEDKINKKNELKELENDLDHVLTNGDLGELNSTATKIGNLKRNEKNS